MNDIVPGDSIIGTKHNNNQLILLYNNKGMDAPKSAPVP